MFQDITTFSRNCIFSLLTFSISELLHLLPSPFWLSPCWASSWVCFSVCPYCRKFSFQTSLDNTYILWSLQVNLQKYHLLVTFRKFSIKYDLLQLPTESYGVATAFQGSSRQKSRFAQFFAPCLRGFALFACMFRSCISVCSCKTVDGTVKLQHSVQLQQAKESHFYFLKSGWRDGTSTTSSSDKNTALFLNHHPLQMEHWNPWCGGHSHVIYDSHSMWTCCIPVHHFCPFCSFCLVWQCLGGFAEKRVTMPKKTKYLGM